MSVIMTFSAAGDPAELERRAAENPEGMRSIAERAKEHGLIAHRFYGSENQIMIIDEWPDPESFQQVATGEPEITFWHKLETHDEVGWE